jgi:hypothetical protein
VGDITNAPAGCSDDETMVWVGTENRNHLLGHLSLLGVQDEPVFPMCSGGPPESYMGDYDILLTDWAQAGRERHGVRVRPHFPTPICEEPVYITLGELDAVEIRDVANAAEQDLDALPYREWYRYLNCGYRVAAVGGTDKMSAGVPVGGVRTYAQLDTNEGMTMDNWGNAVRGGRTYTTSGPLLDLRVDGQPMGAELHLPSGGGTVEIEATAHCLWPMHAMQLVRNGQVIANTTRKNGARELKIHHQAKLTESCWIAVRAGSTWQCYRPGGNNIGAHSSPVYVIVGDQEIFNPSDATYMLTLLDGGMTYLDRLSVRYDEERHQRMLEMFLRARHKLEHRLGIAHDH